MLKPATADPGKVSQIAISRNSAQDTTLILLSNS